MRYLGHAAHKGESMPKRRQTTTNINCVTIQNSKEHKCIQSFRIDLNGGDMRVGEE
jgi:hypothetical protein